MNTFVEPIVAVGRRRRRKHSDEFKAQVVAACSQPGVSIAAVSMAHGVNANLARRWMIGATASTGPEVSDAAGVASAACAPKLALPPPFVEVPMPSASAAPEIRIELRRGATGVNVTWPTSAAAECAAWLRELLR